MFAPLIPRHYQAESQTKLFDYFATNDGNPLVVAPTGSGKSLMIAELVKYVMQHWPTQRMLVLAHVQELIKQNFEELLGQWPSAPAGVYAAGLGSKDLSQPVTYAMIQSIKNVISMLGHIDLIIVDEAHLVSTNQNTMYRTVFEELKKVNPLIKIIGYTATPFRMTTGLLTGGSNPLFTDIAYEIPIKLLIDEGSLAPVVTQGSEVKIDLTNVRKSKGEFKESDLMEAINSSDTFNDDVIDQIILHGEDRKSWIVFCITIEHAEEIAKLLRARGINAQALHSKIKKKDRANLVEAHRVGALKVLVSVNALTTGFNSKATDLGVFLRPTLSPGLYVQMVGRVMRTAPGKVDGKILDFAGNVMRHGPVDMLDIKDKEPGSGDAPCKECPQCNLIVYAGVRFCPKCNFEFEFKSIDEKLEVTASDAAILSSQLKPIEAGVTYVMYSNNNKRKRGGIYDSMVVTYVCGSRSFREYVHVEHGEGRALANARWWFQQRNLPMPATVDEAVATCKLYAMKPESITVEKDGKFDRITRWSWPDIPKPKLPPELPI